MQSLNAVTLCFVFIDSRLPVFTRYSSYGYFGFFFLFILRLITLSGSHFQDKISSLLPKSWARSLFLHNFWYIVWVNSSTCHPHRSSPKLPSLRTARPAVWRALRGGECHCWRLELHLRTSLAGVSSSHTQPPHALRVASYKNMKTEKRTVLLQSSVLLPFNSHFLLRKNPFLRYSLNIFWILTKNPRERPPKASVTETQRCRFVSLFLLCYFVEVSSAFRVSKGRTELHQLKPIAVIRGCWKSLVSIFEPDTRDLPNKKLILSGFQDKAVKANSLWCTGACVCFFSVVHLCSFSALTSVVSSSEKSYRLSYFLSFFFFCWTRGYVR